MFGYNINTLTGNKDIPKGYIFNPDTPINDVYDALDTIIYNTNPYVIRSLIWSADRNQDAITPYLHIPLSEKELNRISTVIDYTLKNSNRAYYHLSYGALWHSLPYIDGDVKPPDPFSFEELVEATLNSFNKLFSYLGNLSVSRILLDVWNELDCRTQPYNMQLMEVLYPNLIDLSLQYKIPVTVSTIIETNGYVGRAKETYDALVNIAKKYKAPMIQELELHCNGFSDENLKKRVKTFVNFFKKRYNCSVSVGECDLMNPSNETLNNIMQSKVTEWCWWVK